MSMPMPPACPDGQLHTVVRGETLFSLARSLGTTIQALLAANPQITNPNVLVIGQQLCIPRFPTPSPTPIPGPFPEPPACPEGIVHTVAPGETLFSLANRYGILLSRVIAANPQIADPSSIAVGQHVCIPTPAVGFPPEIPPPPACAGGTIVTVAAGETMATIARRFGVGLQQMIAANPQVIDPNLLAVGQRLCVPGVVPPPPEVPCPGGRIHQIAPGDTLLAIARANGTTVEAILRANPLITDPNFLRVGQRICIPGPIPVPPPGFPSPPACTGGTIYTVRSGETLSAIARRFGLDLSRLIAANPQLTDPNVLSVGQRICLPVTVPPGVPPAPGCPEGRIHVVAPGETLTSIARANGLTLQELLATNPQITNPDVLTVGQMLCVRVTR